jgi:long-chain acyl-CoA synthetase
MIAYANGGAVWVPTTTFDVLERAAREQPDATALVCDGRRLSYRGYQHCVEVLAGRLMARSPGSRIAIGLRNGMAICVAVLGCQRAGLLPTTLNPDYSARELQPMMEDADPDLVIAHAELVDRFAGRRFLGVHDDGAFIAELLAAPPPAALRAVDPDADAVLQFTGGTTGRPKGVVLTHRAVATNAAQREARLPTDFGDERIVCAMPLFHVFAVAMGLHMAAYAAGTLIILPKYRPDTLLEAITAERATRLPAGPTLFNSLLGYDGLSRDKLASLRCCYSGSAPLSVATLERWERATGVPIHEGYGQSEAGPVLTYTGPEAPAAAGTVGLPLPLTEVRIVDPATGALLPAGTSGEIAARGPQIMRGYLNDPAATAEALRNGWLHTGDIGRLDASGVLTIEDRKKDMAIVGGFNVYPREVDELLMAHPRVSEAAALGVPDGYRGETIWAFVVGRNLSARDVNAWCAEHLVRYKRPTTVRLVDALPRTPAGKIDKSALRRRAAEEQSLVA